MMVQKDAHMLVVYFYLARYLSIDLSFVTLQLESGLQKYGKTINAKQNQNIKNDRKIFKTVLNIY